MSFQPSYKLSIVIPIFNEAATLYELLTRVWKREIPGVEREVILVESNSTDESRQKLQAFLAHPPSVSKDSPISSQLIFQPKPKGKGNAVREGLSAATGDIILIQDADLEYDVGDYFALLEPILQGKTDFVLGSRHLEAGNWKIRKFESSPIRAFFLNLGGVFFHRFFNLLYGQSLTDPTTMYKVFKRSCLEGVSLEADRFDFDFELLAKLLRKGHIPYEVPVNYTSRSFQEGKKIRLLRDPLTWIRAIVKYRFIGKSRWLLAPSNLPIESKLLS